MGGISIESYKAFNTPIYKYTSLSIHFLSYYYYEAIEMMTWIKIEGKLYIT